MRGGPLSQGSLFVFIYLFTYDFVTNEDLVRHAVCPGRTATKAAGRAILAALAASWPRPPRPAALGRCSVVRRTVLPCSRSLDKLFKFDRPGWRGLGARPWHSIYINGRRSPFGVCLFWGVLIDCPRQGPAAAPWEARCNPTGLSAAETNVEIKTFDRRR